MSDLGLVEIVGIVVVLGLLGWQFVFFQFVRPRIMTWVGGRLGIGVRESFSPLHAGLYDGDDEAPLRKSAAVWAADFLVTIGGTVGVLAAVSIPLFLLADSGLPHRWEGLLTGTSVRIGEITVPAFDDHEAVASVVVRHEAEAPAHDCRVSVTDYRARDGYLTGASDAFDLAPGATQTVDLRLRVTTRVPGTHAFRVSLECDRRLRDRATARVQVNP